MIDPGTRISYGELDSTTTRVMAAAFVEAGVGKGTRVGLIMPNGARWVQVAVALTRIGAVLVPLSTLLTARELVAQLRVASVQFLVTVEEFRGHRYLDDLRSELGSPDLGQELVHNPKLPALREVWTAGRLAQARAGGAAARVVDALTKTVTPSDTLAVMFTSGSSGPPRALCIPTATHWGQCDRDLRLAVSTRIPGCICRCRSSGWAASAAGCCRLCWPARHWSPRRSQNREPLCDCWNESGSRCFAAGQIRPKPLHGNPARRSRSVGVAAGQSGGAASARSTGRARCARKAVRHDRSIRTVLWLSRRHRHATIRLG